MNEIGENNYCESLKQAIKEKYLNEKIIQLIIRSEEMDSGKILIDDYHVLTLCDDKKTTEWKASSIRELFRGNRNPPSMERYPEEYVQLFYEIESHVLLFMKSIRICTDEEIEETYTKMAKRPDGVVQGDLHFIIWQAAAFMLGCYEVSAKEYEAIIRRLARSARTWKIGYSSRNYYDYLSTYK